MLRVGLVHMPFGSIHRPAFGLTQIASRLRSVHGDRVSVDMLYMNLDFAEFFGIEEYDLVAEAPHHHSTGVGDWLFRSVAFPELLDNADEYVQTYYPQSHWRSFRERLLARRAGLAAWFQDAADRCHLEQYDVLGFTSTFCQNVASLAMARLAKARNPEVVTVMGGANCEAPMGRPLVENYPELDYVCSGSGLVAFVAFIARLLSGDRDACDRIPGIVSRRNADDPRFRDAIGIELDMDAEIRLDYDDFIQRWRQIFPLATEGMIIPFQTSRGCWWGERSHCTFCGLNGLSMGYRAMSPPAALRQFEQIFEYSPLCQHFECVDNILPRSYLTDVLPHVRTPDGASIFYEVKADLTDEDLAVLHRARVRLIQPGIEALATSVLKLMGKGTTAFQNVRLLKNCLTHGITAGWNLLIGFPGEDPAVFEKYHRDLPTLVHLQPPSGVYTVRFDRYSQYYLRPDDFDLDLAPIDYYELIYPFDAAALRDLAYYFVDRNLGDYVLNAGEWHVELSSQVRRWKQLWQPERRPVLELERDADGFFVRDTRFDAEEMFRLTALGVEVLRALDSPRRQRDLTVHGADPADVETWVRELRSRRCLFEEGERMMSLVHWSPAAAGADATSVVATASA